MFSSFFQKLLEVIRDCCGNTYRFALPFLLALVIPLLTSQGESATKETPRFWSPLTPFETKILRNIDAARGGDPDALLALSLMASGDIRNQQNYDRIKKHVHAFVEQIRPRIDRTSTGYGKGEILLNAMHAHFFKGGKDDAGSELISGYDSEQSKVSTIFETGRFNCISSAILYMILARYFDLSVQGVVTTEHAFIQIIADGGRIIEVETTSKNGYGLVHDKTFFKESFTRFSESRNLSVPAYEDYLKRRVVLPYILITENMNHQHTAPARMDKDTRQRLDEFMGFVDLVSASAQLARLDAYYNGCFELFYHRTRGDIDKMRSVLTPVIRHIKKRPWINDTQRKDVAAIWTRIAAVHLILGRLLQSESAYDSAQQHFTKAVQWAPTPKLKRKAQKNLHELKAYRAFKNNKLETAIKDYQYLIAVIGDSDPHQTQKAKEGIAAARWNMGNIAQRKRKWKTAANHYAAIEKWSRDAHMLQNAKAARAGSNAMYHFERRQWADAIRFFKVELSNQDRDARDVVRNNIGAAYVHWGNELFTGNAYKQALDKYEAALEMVTQDKKRAVYLNIAGTYHNLAVPLLRKRRTAEALDILKSGVKRFPQCNECQNELNKQKRKVKRFFR